jgi:hypothetical protein
MEHLVVALEGPQELVESVAEIMDRNTIECSKPVRMTSVGDVIDSPIGAEEVKLILTNVVLVFKSAAAVTGFATALISLIRKWKTPVTLRNPQTGAPIGTVTNDDDETKVRTLLGL